MRKILLFVLFVSATFISKAQDRYFARTYTTNILTKNAVDLEFSHTSRFGHKNQFFHAQDQRMEIEIGVGNSWQTAFYFNRYQERYSDSNDGTVTSNEIGFSNEWKWKVQQQGKHKPAIALYGEWGVKGGDEIELETKLILDKWVGKSLWAFNAVAEYEKEFKWQNGKLESGKWEAPVEFDLAYMYSLKPNLGIGFEIRNHNEISKEGWEHSVFFGGPTLDYHSHNWFIIFNYLPQWINVHKTSVAPFNKVLDEHERVEARILLGISILN